jgi:hypothetical protein
MSSAAYNRHKGMFEAFSFVKRITSLSEQDVQWIRELSNGKTYKQLTGATSEQVAKNRLRVVRRFLGTQNTPHTIAEAIRRGIIK